MTEGREEEEKKYYGIVPSGYLLRQTRHNTIAPFTNSLTFSYCRYWGNSVLSFLAVKFLSFFSSASILSRKYVYAGDVTARSSRVKFNLKVKGRLYCLCLKRFLIYINYANYEISFTVIATTVNWLEKFDEVTRQWGALVKPRRQQQQKSHLQKR